MAKSGPEMSSVIKCVKTVVDHSDDISPPEHSHHTSFYLPRRHCIADERHHGLSRDVWTDVLPTAHGEDRWQRADLAQLPWSRGHLSPERQSVRAWPPDTVSIFLLCNQGMSSMQHVDFYSNDNINLVSKANIGIECQSMVTTSYHLLLSFIKS